MTLAGYGPSLYLSDKRIKNRSFHAYCEKNFFPEMGDLADFCPFLPFSAIFGPPYLLKLDFDRLDFLDTDKRLLEL